MTYAYFGDSSSYVYHVDKTRNSIHEISPSFFDIDADGCLQISDKFYVGFVSQMHQRGIKVVPFLSNHWNREAGRNALKKRKALASQIAAVVVKYGFD